MSTSTKIEFENENDVYRSGELLKGRATFTLTEEKIVRGIYVRIHGMGHCEWSHYDSRNPADKTIEGNETYMDERIYLVGSRESESELGDTTVAAGTYTYPFECQLPREIPSSLEVPCGSIKYVACVVLDRPSWQIPTPQFPFTVVKPLNLSTHSTVHEPVTVGVEHRFHVCCLLRCWKTKPLHMLVNIPKSGFVPDETINIDLNVKNPSSETIMGVLAQIVQRIDAHANDGKKRTERKELELNFKMLPGIRSGEEKLIKGEILVPDVLPSDESSNILKLSYALRFIAYPGLCQTNAVLDVPIIIGSALDRGSSTGLVSGENRLRPSVHPPTQSQPAGTVDTLALNAANNPPSYDEVISWPPGPIEK